MSAARPLPAPRDVWEELSQRADSVCRFPDFRSRQVRDAIKSALRGATLVRPYVNSVGMATEIFLEHGGLTNYAATANAVETYGLAADALRQRADELDAAALTIDVAHLDLLSEQGGAR